MQKLIGKAVVKHYSDSTNPILKFADDEWEIVGDREDAEQLAHAINKLIDAQRLGSSDDL